MILNTQKSCQTSDRSRYRRRRKTQSQIDNHMYNRYRFSLYEQRPNQWDWVGTEIHYRNLKKLLGSETEIQGICLKMYATQQFLIKYMDTCILSLYVPGLNC